MKRTLKIVILAVMTITLLAGCKSFSPEGRYFAQAKVDAKANDYVNAVYNAIEALRIDPQYYKVMAFMDETYKAANNYYDGMIKKAQRSEAEFASYDIWFAYDSLVKINYALEIEEMYSLINPKKGIEYYMELQDYTAEAQEWAEVAAEDYYQAAKALLKDGGTDKSKLASKYLIVVETIIPGYKDASSLEGKAREAAMRNVAFLPFDERHVNTQGVNISRGIMQAVKDMLLSDSRVKEYTKFVDQDSVAMAQEEINKVLAGSSDTKSLEVGKLAAVNTVIKSAVVSVDFKPVEWDKDTRQIDTTVDFRIVDADGNDILDDDGLPMYETREVTGYIIEHEAKTSLKVSIAFDVVDLSTTEIIYTGKADGSISTDFTYNEAWGDYNAVYSYLSDPFGWYSGYKAYNNTTFYYDINNPEYGADYYFDDVVKNQRDAAEQWVEEGADKKELFNEVIKDISEKMAKQLASVFK